MLDTVLAIGNVLRQAPDGVKYHRYVKPLPPKPQSPIHYWSIPCSLDGSFDFDQRTPLIDENVKLRLLYLNYKKTDADSSKKFIYGDIYRFFKRDKKAPSKNKEAGGNYITPPRKDSFNDGINDIESQEILKTPRLKQFRDCFENQKENIHRFLIENDHAYIHFDFEGKHWYQLEEWNALEEAFLQLFFQSDDKRGGYSLRSFLFKTLSHDREDAARLPGFQKGIGSHQARLFKDKNEALSLFYGIDAASSAALRRNDIKVIVLPVGDNLKWQPLTQFLGRNFISETDIEIEEQEEQLERENADEDIFSIIDKPSADQFVQYDFIISQARGTKPDIDCIELSGLKRSKLVGINQRLRRIRDEIEAQRRMFLSPTIADKLTRLNILRSFFNLLGDSTKAKKKYQNHLLRVLPQILTENYYRDPVLLSALIEKTEFNIRNNDSNFNLLKFDFYLLSKIQNYEEDRLMAVKESASYRIGNVLGRMSRRFKPEFPNPPIRSFEKNYVGLLSRRTSSIEEVKRLSNDINQKLVMHRDEKHSFPSRIYAEFTSAVNNFEGVYDKSEFAFGFFESYFAPVSKTEEQTNETEKSDE